MERIVEVTSKKISEIRGYMANSGKDCASGTCDCGGGPYISAEDILIKELEEVSEEFFI
ncbi:hypothetical protein RHD99_13370 [Buttiauxella selenatireducens]|uniref:Uncharacterized protein n=1 Tax=Buttiauxella selenatireducens TaxID=3073902 RepID=A0ABY9S5T0_9ENTR|nr:hypothetical protein [Buttiauxella sp. R73]WMY72476.1 hypothetical protein RHD99_13370 [Buttiauxella sp. R73]